jgi:hypothetical protein
VQNLARQYCLRVCLFVAALFVLFTLAQFFLGDSFMTQLHYKFVKYQSLMYQDHSVDNDINPDDRRALMCLMTDEDIETVERWMDYHRALGFTDFMIGIDTNPKQMESEFDLLDCSSHLYSHSENDDDLVELKPTRTGSSTSGSTSASVLDKMMSDKHTPMAFDKAGSDVTPAQLRAHSEDGTYPLLNRPNQALCQPGVKVAQLGPPAGSYHGLENKHQDFIRMCGNYAKEQRMRWVFPIESDQFVLFKNDEIPLDKHSILVCHITCAMSFGADKHMYCDPRTDAGRAHMTIRTDYHDWLIHGKYEDQAQQGFLKNNYSEEKDKCDLTMLNISVNSMHALQKKMQQQKGQGKLRQYLKLLREGIRVSSPAVYKALGLDPADAQ